jgi:hypothetical protein
VKRGAAAGVGALNGEDPCVPVPLKLKPAPPVGGRVEPALAGEDGWLPAPNENGAGDAPVVAPNKNGFEAGAVGAGVEKEDGLAGDPPAWYPNVGGVWVVGVVVLLNENGLPEAVGVAVVGVGALNWNTGGTDWREVSIGGGLGAGLKENPEVAAAD